MVEMKDLEKALTGLIGDLKSAPFEPNEAKEFWAVYLDRSEKDNGKWLTYMSEALETATTFEIHCWNEEPEWIDFALRYGKLKDDDWRYGKIIVGEVTPEFVKMLMEQPKPSDIEIYNKMTPFFTIALDNGFWSSHYGTELTRA